MNKTLNIFFVIFLCAICALSACKGKRKTLVEIGNEKGILHIGNFDEPADVDPHTTTGMPEFHLEMAIFEGLISKDPKTLAVIPGVSDSWTISEDKKTYRFHIRNEAKWSDGSKLTAFDFEYAWRRMLNPAIGSDYAPDFFIIKNAELFYTGELKKIDEVGFKALDENTFQVELKYPIAYFLIKLDHHSFFPVNKKLLEKFNAFGDRSTLWTRPENIITNGAFKVKEWIPGVVFSVIPNPYYWDSKVVKLNEIRFYPVNNLLLEEKMFRTGQLHKTEFLPGSKVDYYRNKPEYTNFPFYANYFYALNLKIKPLDDVRVRKALAYSIDRKAITENILRGGQPQAFHYTPDDPNGYSATANMVYDLNLAKKLLAEAGYPEGKGFPPLSILYNTHSDHQKIALAIQQMWKENLGIDISLRNMEWKVYLSERDLGKFEILRRASVADMLDPSTFLDAMRTGDPFNDTNWGSQRFDQLMKMSLETVDDEKRFAYFKEADQILVDEVPLIPLYFYTTNNLVATSVKGYFPNVMDYHPYKYVYLESK